jgi:hypothetical protein
MKDIGETLRSQIDILESTLKETELISKKLNRIAKKAPLKPIHLRDTDFRFKFFNYKPVFSEGGALYKDVLKRLSDYIIKNKLYLENGNIKCDELLKKYCYCESVSFFKLCAALRRILV